MDDDMKKYIMKGLGYKLLGRDSSRDEAAFIGRMENYAIPELMPHEIDAGVDIKKLVFSKLEMFHDLQIGIQNLKDVPNSLICYCEPEHLKALTEFGDNRWHCNDGVLRPAIKGVRFSELPIVMALDLRRSYYSTITGRVETLCDSFEVPATLDMTETRYNHIFNFGCKRRKYILIGMIAGTYDPYRNFTTWHARVRISGTVKWKRCINLRDLAHHTDFDYQPENIMSEKQALDVSRGKVGDMMAMHLLYMDVNASKFSDPTPDTIAPENVAPDASDQKRDQYSDVVDHIKSISNFINHGSQSSAEYALDDDQYADQALAQVEQLEDEAEHENLTEENAYLSGEKRDQNFQQQQTSTEPEPIKYQDGAFSTPTVFLKDPAFDNTMSKKEQVTDTVDISEIPTPRKKLDSTTLQKRLERRKKPSKHEPCNTVETSSMFLPPSSSYSSHWVNPLQCNQQHKDTSIKQIREDEQINSRKCTRCKSWVSRGNSNNNHLSCRRCGTEFCFLCGHVLKGHKEYDTGKPHFANNTCKQHIDLVVKLSASSLNKLGHVKPSTESVAAFSIQTEDALLPPSNKHAKARAKERNVTDMMQRKTILHGVEEQTYAKDGTPSVLYRYKTNKVWTSEDGKKVLSVV